MSAGNDDHCFDAGRVRFVLVQPRSAGNAGAAARAIKNLGFSRLVLVQPAFELLDERALTMAVEARDVLAAARVMADLDEALAGAAAVVGTTRRTGKHRRPHWRLDRFGLEMVRLAGAGELALVFGREDSGLSDVELDRCTHLIHLPASERYGSFNLAQAVLLTGYELRRAALEPAADPLDPPASHEQREALYGHLERALQAVGFLQPDPAVSIMRQLRRLFGRACLTPHEVRILRGVAHQMLWAAGRAGLIDAEANGATTPSDLPDEDGA